MISIIISAYNSVRFLSQTVSSVLAQTRPDWELIIVDDGSSDGTRSVAEEFALRDGRIRYVWQENAGPSAARNRGLVEARTESEFLIFLDHDDVWHAQALAVLSDALARDAGASAAHALASLVNERGDPVSQDGSAVRREEAEPLRAHRKGISDGRVVAWPHDAPSSFAVLACGCCITTPGVVLVRRTALEAVAGFDPEVDGCEDWDLWLRLCRRGHIACVNEVLLDYRRHDDSYSANRERRQARSGTAIWKAFIARENTPSQRDVMLLALANYLGRQLNDRDLATIAGFFGRLLAERAQPTGSPPAPERASW